MIAASFMALVNQGLQVQNHVGIARAQRNADDGEPFAQADGIDFALLRAGGPKEADTVTGVRLLEDTPNGRGKDRSALPHEVNFDEINPATLERVTFSKVPLSLDRFEFVARAEQLQRRNQPGIFVTDLEPTFDLFNEPNPDRF